ncbi:conserved hypothetical protein [Deferribacter desulfuricans SSM1]|uniref:Xylose isomerase-like TIM barrel domain-containing protein n=1 Tax=Deferribacter desulfuricans (strain DSM 14783 / JCM 11476 / NBRC 101012 / SSM1) TaxID=639282 RepID=D3P9W1_DEFDS|nr:cobamide remodeling phosphodiesterase CbiR [Deferribacter desulfuricans]BAI81501.1 conserved hypothetical protein [Deferribacter desulfuricans SSM1]
MKKEIPKLATTSFIYQDTRIMNVLKLKHLFDEIELLFFESKREYDQLDKNELTLLNKIDTKYSAHLPYDRNLNDTDDLEYMISFIKNLNSLNVSYFFLHSKGDDFESIEKICHLYPSVLVENTVSSNIFDSLKNTKIKYCYDIGHSLLNNENPFEIIKKYGEKIKYIHLHGVNADKDHQEICHLDINLVKYIFDFAIDYNITISIELFDFSKLLNSLNYLLEVFNKYGYSYHRWN